ncbi:pseudouridine synthase [Labilibaculum filiforme]|uniref:pseudouridine synthase n=1 Tax=Labilibaculum filiforme TaxID=1940526 RepID=UPI000C6EB2A5|nr:pseudouridine synthase [Labilibaculum filiforme]
MEEKKYGKDRREKSSFRPKTENDRKPGGTNPRFKKDSESRNNEGNSEYPRQRRDNSEKPFQRDNARPQSSRRFDGDDSERNSDRRRTRSEEPNRKFGRDSESRNRNTGDQSDNSDRRGRESNRNPRNNDSRSRSSRTVDDSRNERDSYRGKPRAGDSNRKFGRDSGSRDRNYSDRSENSDKRNREFDRTSRDDDSKSRSPRKFDDSRSERDSDRRKYKSDDSEFRPRRDADRSNRREEKSDFTKKGKRFTDDFEEDQDLNEKPYDRFKNKPDKETLQKKHYSKKKQLAFAKKSGPEDGLLRLNKYISNTGACSRRTADQRIEEGRITVNGEIVKEVGTKVNIEDVICMDGKQLEAEAKVYLVLNKPKDFVTTLDDPLGRKTVLDLIQNACSERVYPVGRLDRMTTGVLLFTNDGDLTKRLTHPSYNKKKIYHVFLNRAISQEELDQVITGIELEDGEIKADAISFASDTDKTQVGIEIHSGRNRIVRRIFEHLGYEIEKLDRVLFAGITKKNIPRGKWRFLSEKEVQMLKIY